MTAEEIEKKLRGRDAARSEATTARPAAVALIVREVATGPEILYIVRAESPRDPWSGNIGFPGGRIDARDPSARAAAERETMEEVGIDLSGARFLGQLDDLVGANLPVVVSCFVYLVDDATRPIPGDEVAEAFWVPLSALVDPGLHDTVEVFFSGKRFVKPAITVLPEGKPVLWGITYHLTMQLLHLLDSGVAAACQPPSTDTSL